MKKIIDRDLFFLTGKTSTFGSPVFPNAVQVMTNYKVFFFKIVFLFICFGSSFPTPLVFFPLLNNTFQLIIQLSAILISLGCVCMLYILELF